MIRRWRKKRAINPSPHELIPPEGVPLQLAVAGVGVRLGAQIIDVLITGFAWVAILILLGALDATSASTFQAVAILLFFFIRIPYYVLSELAWNGQTLGKRMTSIKVVAYDGGPLTAYALVSRNLMKEAEVFLPGSLLFAMGGDQPIFSIISLVWIIVAFAIPALSYRKRRLGDMIAGTYVIHLPIPILFKDMAAEPNPMAVQQAFPFLPHQLDHYGAFELQTLEALLRAQSNNPRTTAAAKNQSATLASVVDRIRKKIEYADAVKQGDQLKFLQAFYNAQRAHLEQRQLFGDRRADKHHAREDSEG